MKPTGVIAAMSLLGVAGLALVIVGLSQPAPSLARTVGRLHRRAGDADTTTPLGAADRLSRPLVTGLVEFARRQPRSVPSDAQLRVIGRSIEQHVLYLAAASITGLVVPGMLVALMQRAGLLGLGWFAPVIVSVAGALMAPSGVHSAAIERANALRVDLRYQVSAYLDVVTMLLAGNTGYEGALEQASRVGDGRLFTELRRSMRDAGTRGASLTDALERTGIELGLDELVQVASTARLSASEGAPVARTLAAKCATLRAALASDQESEARLRTSRLTTPIVGMALIFMALVIYPALSFS